MGHGDRAGAERPKLTIGASDQTASSATRRPVAPETAVPGNEWRTRRSGRFSGAAPSPCGAQRGGETFREVRTSFHLAGSLSPARRPHPKRGEHPQEFTPLGSQTVLVVEQL